MVRTDTTNPFKDSETTEDPPLPAPVALVPPLPSEKVACADNPNKKESAAVNDQPDGNTDASASTVVTSTPVPTKDAASASAQSNSVPISNPTPPTTLNQLSPWLVASETLSGPSAAQQAAKMIKESSITRKTVITTQL